MAVVARTEATRHRRCAAPLSAAFCFLFWPSVDRLPSQRGRCRPQAHIPVVASPLSRLDALFLTRFVSPLFSFGLPPSFQLFSLALCSQAVIQNTWWQGYGRGECAPADLVRGVPAPPCGADAVRRSSTWRAGGATPHPSPSPFGTAQRALAVILSGRCQGEQVPNLAIVSQFLFPLVFGSRVRVVFVLCPRTWPGPRGAGGGSASGPAGDPCDGQTAASLERPP